MTLTSYSHQIVGWILLISFIVSIVVGIIGFAIMKYEGATTAHSFSYHRKYYKTSMSIFVSLKTIIVLRENINTNNINDI